MRALAILSVLFLPAALSQTIASSEAGSEFFNQSGLTPLKCQVRPIRPILDFAFRYHAGLSFKVPFNQYRGSGHSWTVGLRIQPEAGGTPVYLIDRLDFPQVPTNRLDAETEAEFLLGEGSYRAAALLVDDENRSCRAEWNIEAKLAPAESSVRLALAPGTIEPPGAPLIVGAGGVKPSVDRLTVLLHASPVTPTMARLHAGDAATILTSLVSLLNQVQARSTRLVVFSLDQQKELYRSDNFTPDHLPDVQQAIISLQLGVVRYGALKHPNGYLDQLTELVKAETATESPANLVVFLGPHSRLCGKPLTDDAMEKPGSSAPKFFYLEYIRPVALPLENESSSPENWLDSSQSPDLHLGDSNLTPILAANPTSLPLNFHPTELDLSHDAIDHMMSSIKGKTLIIRKPDDLARAIVQLRP